MSFDAHTLELLEFARVKEIVATRARSELGRELVLAMTPGGDLSAIHESLGRSKEMIDALDARLDPPLGGLADLRRPLQRSKVGILLDVEDMARVRDFADLTGSAHDFWARLGTDYPRLGLLLSDVADQRSLARSMDAVLDRDGTVRDSATRELGELRAKRREQEERIQSELRRMLRSAEVRKALRFPESTLSGEHHVLPVAINYRHLIAGVVHRVSSSGETVYIEPAVIARISAEIAIVKAAEEREVRRALRRLTSMIAEVADSLLIALDILAEIDRLQAIARTAQVFELAIPEVVASGPLRLDNARHPLLLDRCFRMAKPEGPAPRELVVPISLTLGDPFDLLVITGPNTGGKTVSLKTVGLLTAMALAGFPIPARPGSQVPLFEDILADIGDEQSLEQSLSTFSSHMTRIASILSRSGPRTLFLLDELGAGTDPSEGSALGRAILDDLLAKHSRGMVTTHLGDLKTYALARSRVENAAAEFDPDTLRPTYRLLIGQFGKSCALSIARRLKLPRTVLRRAGVYLKRRRDRASGDLNRLADLRREATIARENAQRAQDEAKLAAQEFQQKATWLAQENAVKEELLKFRASLREGDVVRVARFDKLGTVVRVDRRRLLAQVTVGNVQWELPLDDLLPQPRSMNDK